MDKYNEKGQVRFEYAEDTAKKAEYLINQLVMLNVNYTYSKSYDRLKRWLNS